MVERKDKSIIKITDDKKYFLKIYPTKSSLQIESENLMKNIKHSNLIEFVRLYIMKNYNIFSYVNYECIDLITIYENYEKYSKLIEPIKFKISQQLIDVVKFLHNNNICHRDIKLDNILFKNNDILLCDYEYCIRVDDKGNNIDNIIKYVGTKIYMSPEVINQLPILNYKNIDIWNTGLVIYIIMSDGNMPMYNTYRDWHLYYCESSIQKHLIKIFKEKELSRITNFFKLSLNYYNHNRKLLDIVT